MVCEMDPVSSEYGLEDLIDILFGVGQRRIFACKVARPVTHFSGCYKRRPTKYWVTAGKRRFPVGTDCLVRMDKRTPDYVEVEFFDGWGDDFSWEYLLTRAQFEFLQPKLELVESRNDVANYNRHRDGMRSE